ncbi:MAG: class I SAM-dependent methyltransferase family protein [Candidatus Methanospirare jalkutatii]|nr:class I SAM-dependent methyltransferase family protein [Candidatus Methanospirare jalkutatii]
MKEELPCVCVEKRRGEEVRRILREHALLNGRAKVVAEGNLLFFPLKEAPSEEIMLKLKDASVFRRVFEVREEEKDITAEKLPKFSYEIVGDIALLELSKEDKDVSESPQGKFSEFSEVSEEDLQRISDLILRRHKNVKVVALKASAVEGVFRKRRIRILKGEQRTETIHRENGCVFKLDLEKVYFNPKLASERKRVAEKVAAGECVVDMFAGVGTFSILIAKCSPESKVIAIDINPDAIFYLRENIRLNKVSNVSAIQGDVREVSGKFAGVADRIIMNLPKESHFFLKDALRMLKNRGIIHFYTIESAYTADEMRGSLSIAVQRAEQKLRAEFAHASRLLGCEVAVNVISARKVRPYAPYTFILGFDLAVEKRNGSSSVSGEEALKAEEAERA